MGEPSSPHREAVWNVDVLLGLPTGVRAQRLLFGNEGLGLDIEGFVGFELIFPTVGGGLRLHWAPLCGERNALTISPGVDAYVLYNWVNADWFPGSGPTTIPIYAADIEISWRHALKNSLETELGIKVGAGAAPGGVVPVGGVYFGFHF